MATAQKTVMLVGAAGGLGTVIQSIVGGETDWRLIDVTRDRVHHGGQEIAFDSGSRAAWRTLLDSPEWRPDVIINAAAMTNVDACETNRTEAWRSNVVLTENIVAECKRHDIKLVQVSTDYVFDGASGPYSESASPNPVNYYGKTKLASENACIGGEINVAVVRTMWLYGDHRGRKASFVTWLVDMLANGKHAPVVTDEIGNPTFNEDVAYGIIKIIDRDARGIINIAGPDLMSRWDFATAIAQVYDLDTTLLTAVESSQLQRTARRPLRSGLISLRAQTSLGLRLTGVVDGLGTARILQQRTIR